MFEFDIFFDRRLKRQKFFSVMTLKSFSLSTADGNFTFPHFHIFSKLPHEYYKLKLARAIKIHLKGFSTH